MSDDIALKIDHVYKDFVLPHEKKNSLKEKVIHFTKPSYETFHVLKDINITIKKGEFFGIVGRNGSGKSTLLKIIGGIYQPTKGTVTVNGTLTPFIELGIGFNPELSGRDNVFLNGAILGLTRKEIIKKYDEIVAFAELEKFMDQKLKNYSSGMMVRLAFAIAIQAHNEILLIDEVLAVGDASFQRKCFRTFKEIRRSGKTVIFVSHDMGAIREYCDRAILIESGEVISSGPSDQVGNDYIRLFNKDASNTTNDGSKRWGDMRVTLEDVKVKASQKALHIEYKVHAKEAVSNPIFGTIIKDQDGHHLIDSNTKWKKIKTGEMKKDEVRSVAWKLPNILKTGRYSVTVAAAHEDGLGFYDWRDEVVNFDVLRDTETAGLIMVDDEITLN